MKIISGLPFLFNISTNSSRTFHQLPQSCLSRTAKCQSVISGLLLIDDAAAFSSFFISRIHPTFYRGFLTACFSTTSLSAEVLSEYLRSRDVLKTIFQPRRSTVARLRHIRHSLQHPGGGADPGGDQPQCCPHPHPGASQEALQQREHQSYERSESQSEDSSAHGGSHESSPPASLPEPRHWPRLQDHPGEPGREQQEPRPHSL